MDLKLENLPDEILVEIFTQLDLESLQQLYETDNIRIQNIIEDNLFWKEMVRKKYGEWFVQERLYPKPIDYYDIYYYIPRIDSGIYEVLIIPNEIINDKMRVLILVNVLISHLKTEEDFDAIIKLIFEYKKDATRKYIMEFFKIILEINYTWRNFDIVYLIIKSLDKYNGKNSVIKKDIILFFTIYMLSHGLDIYILYEENPDENIIAFIRLIFKQYSNLNGFFENLSEDDRYLTEIYLGKKYNEIRF